MKRIACLLFSLVLCCALFACGQREAPTVTTTEAAAATQPAADYFTMVWGWACPPGEYATYIDAIYHTESGTAGSSGKAALSAVALLKLSNAASEDGGAMAAIFDSMNDAQARFFASQWMAARFLAEEALGDPAQFRESYGWAGLEDFDAAPYSRDKINRLEGEIASLLCRQEMR